MKGAKLFGSIVYYIFTFLFGLFLALTLPNYFLVFQEMPRYTADALNRGEFYNVMLLTGNYFNKEEPLNATFDDGGGIVLYEAVMPVDERAVDKDKDAVSGTLYKTYLGYVYGVKDSYDTLSETNNQSRLLVTDKDGKTVTVQILDFDSNGDKVCDGITMQRSYGCFVLDLKQSQVGSIKTLELRDKQDNVFWRSETLSLNFDTPFFNAFDEYIPEFNQLIAAQHATDSSDLKHSLDIQLTTLYEKFRSELTQNPNYVVVGSGNEEYSALRGQISHGSTVKASLIIVSYFVVIYVIGDFLLGGRYILKFFRWFLFKVCKIPHKQKAPKKEEVFGHDYYSMVTLSLDLTEVPEFSGSVQIKYTNSDREALFTLMKAENYTATSRIKAGVYVNPHIDINRDYAPVDLPDNLVIEGYRVEKTVKIVKRDVLKGKNAEPAEPTAEPAPTTSETAESTAEPAQGSTADGKSE